MSSPLFQAPTADSSPDTEDVQGVTEAQGGKNSGDTPAADEFKPITSQRELDAALKGRLERERAKFKDYDDLKAKADMLDQIEQANLSELDKANSRATTAESERDNANAEALRVRKFVEHFLNDEQRRQLEIADEFLTGRDEETLTAQAKRLASLMADQAKAEADRKKKHPFVPKEGTSTNSGTTTEEDDREFAKTFFGGGS
ncbi:MAG: hypothetical protein K2X00_23995 [Nitrospiraceae bacterium]|nr:hypothetical protein [Nitrospiraceae bacterium]